MAFKSVRLTPQAERDLNSETVYLAEEADAEIGIRFFFEKYLIFYRVAPRGIDVVRILHGARDIGRVLDEETHSSQ